MQPAPSLRIWICSLTIVCIIFGSLYLLATDPALLVLNYKRLTDATQKETDLISKKKHIVSIGSSITRHAIYYDGEMNAFARQNGFDNFLFIRFVLGGSHLSQFYPLFDHIIAAKPDIVLFQSSFIAYKKKFQKKHHGQIHSYRYFFKQYVKYGISFGTSFKKFRHNRKQQEPLSLRTIKKRQSRSQTPSRLKRIAKRRMQWSLRKIDEIPDELDQFFKQAADAGIKVIILNLPRSEKSKAGLPGTEEEYIRLMKDYENNYQIHCLDYPYQLGLESFVDYHHMTPTSRENYSSWLLKQLNTLID